MRFFLGLCCTCLAISCGSPDEKVGSASSALTADQCMYFDVNGKDTICHATGAANNQFVKITVSDSACKSAHANHAFDKIAINGDCGPAACLPVGAPCDTTLGCCSGLECTNGTCVAKQTCFPTVTTTTTPQQCDQSTDPVTNAPYVICTASDAQLWISANNFGAFHIDQICASYGYTLSAWTGSYGSVCGTDQWTSSCSSPGTFIENQGTSTDPDCGSDACGPLWCNTISWLCTR